MIDKKEENRGRMIREHIYFVVHYAFIVSVESNGGRKPVSDFWCWLHVTCLCNYIRALHVYMYLKNGYGRTFEVVNSYICVLVLRKSQQERRNWAKKLYITWWYLSISIPLDILLPLIFTFYSFNFFIEFS